MLSSFFVVVPVFAVIAMGWAAARFAILRQETGNGISDYVFVIAIPLMLLRTLATAPLPPCPALEFLGFLLPRISGGMDAGDGDFPAWLWQRRAGGGDSRVTVGLLAMNAARLADTVEEFLVLGRTIRGIRPLSQFQPDTGNQKTAYFATFRWCPSVGRQDLSGSGNPAGAGGRAAGQPAAQAGGVITRRGWSAPARAIHRPCGP